MRRRIGGIYNGERIAKKRVLVDGMAHFFCAKGAELIVVKVPGSKLGNDWRHASLHSEAHNMRRVFLRYEELFKSALGEEIGNLGAIHLVINITCCLRR